MLHYCFRDATSRCLISSNLMTRYRKSYSHCHKALYVVALSSCCWGLQLREKAAKNFTLWQLNCVVHTIHPSRYPSNNVHWLSLQVQWRTNHIWQWHSGRFCTRTHQEMRQRTWSFTQCTRKLPEFAEITQNNGHYAVQGHSRSSILVPIESSYTISY